MNATRTLHSPIIRFYFQAAGGSPVSGRRPIGLRAEHEDGSSSRVYTSGKSDRYWVPVVGGWLEVFPRYSQIED
jgi:hypothetical protein